MKKIYVNLIKNIEDFKRICCDRSEALELLKISIWIIENFKLHPYAQGLIDCPLAPKEHWKAEEFVEILDQIKWKFIIF